MTSPADPKAALRRHLRLLRPAMDAQVAQATAIRRELRTWLPGLPFRIIASFAALPGEPALLPLTADLPDRRWVFPRVEGDRMTFHFADASALVPGSFGIPEPAAEAPTCPVEDIELFLCPGMGFTTAGHRIGRGKGYYDRALARSNPQATRVGVCFGEQIVADIPTDPHDLPMHFLAHPAGILECR
ncbi:5-formyltetrahydrofolate cyclo-ligase [Luteolibacter marinus]|uniref:5-formyltetrahydrofolate cyclo-ligase n=1 Tax=Luteolibacter marinus TaxID=2776705 RepID=UPI0018664570